MEEVLIKVLYNASNCVVLQTPGRNYPGLVIQGDSLCILLARAERVCALATQLDNTDLLAEAEALRDDLKWRASVYQQVCEPHGIQ